MTWPFRQTGGPLLSMYMKSRKVFPGAGELTQSVNPCYGSVRTRVQSLEPPKVSVRDGVYRTEKVDTGESLGLASQLD